ncbi:MAG: transcription termination factor Rho [Verrucomicrobiota bacterium]|nr:transcription termination factor Rho [Verrucomicrobiota bacterium]
MTSDPLHPTPQNPAENGTPRQGEHVDKPQGKVARPYFKKGRRFVRRKFRGEDLVGTDLNISDLQSMAAPDLFNLARDYGVEDFNPNDTQALVFQILKKNAEKYGHMVAEGIVEITQEGYGFLRYPKYHYLPCPEDVYISPSQIKRFGLRTGDQITGHIRPPKDNERFFALLKIEAVDGNNPDGNRLRMPFEQLTAEFPKERLILEHDPHEISSRVIDLLCPIGRGQRSLIVAPPRTGKTVLMQKISTAVTANYPELVQIILLIDERPEEVTDMERNLQAEIIASTFDENPARHIQVAELAMERAKRMVENKKHVLIMLDSITRLSRAYNNMMPSNGRVLSGGVDAKALMRPRKFFSSARNVEEGGSLTIIATALVDTGSKADELIFEEFKGTGNMELYLSRDLSDMRIYPAVDVARSGTRREEILLHPDELRCVNLMRKAMGTLPAVEAYTNMLGKLSATQSNAEFLMKMQFV